MNRYINPKNYINFATNKSFSLFAPLIRKWEKCYLENYDDQPLKHQPVFIIGAPRTGSTILYQALTNMFDVLYVDNLVCRLHRNLFFGFWLSDKIYGNKPHNNFQAYHGRTKGGNAPSECGQFWYRWLPKDRHFIDNQDITSDMVEEIRREITAVSNYFDKPLVFKNLNAGQRLRLLTKCFPEARFIFIVRDQVYTSQAILLAKRQIGLTDNTFWSIMPPNVQDLKKLDWDEQIAKQVYYQEKQIVEDSSLVQKENFYTIHYNDLSLEYIAELAKQLGLQQRSNAQKPEIYVHEKQAINTEEFNRLRRQVAALDWSFFSEKFQPQFVNSSSSEDAQ